MDIRRGVGNRLHGDRPAHSGVLQGCARIPMSAMIDSPRDRAARRPRKSEASQRYDSPRGFMFHKQARQESNLQPPVLERNPSNAGVAAFVDFQRLNSKPATPALLDNAGVGTNPGTEIAYGQNLRRGLRISRADVAHLMLRVLEQAETIKQVIGIAN